MALLALTSNHARKTSTIHVRKVHPALTSNHERNQSSHLCQKGPALTFDHARNQSNIHVKKALHLHSTMRGTNPTYMLKELSAPGWGFLVTNQMPPFSQRMASALISDQVGTHPSITSEWPYTYIWSCENTSHSHIRMALSPRLSIPGNWPGASIQRMAFNTYIWSCRNQSYSHIRMA